MVVKMGITTVVMTYPKRYREGKKLSEELNCLLSVDVKSEGAFIGSILGWEKTLTIANSHCMLLQDDIEPCPDFYTAVEHVISSKPNSPISLFNRISDALSIQKQGISFLEMEFYSQGPAWIIPSEIVKHMVMWIPRNLRKLPFSDPAYALYFYYQKIPVLVALPSLVQHTGTAATSYKKNVASGCRASYVCPNGATEFFSGKTLQVAKNEKEMEWLNNFNMYKR